MPVSRYLELNGFEFTITTFHGHPEVLVNIRDEKTVQAIKDSDIAFLAGLEKLADDYQEIDSVLLAEESFGMWFQSSYANNKQAELHRILHSEYASDELKQKVRQELGFVTKPALNVSFMEWSAMMYGVYQAMPEEEKQALHEWERQYVDGSGKHATSDWPGWEKYIGKRIVASQVSKRKKRQGHIYLVRASTGEYKIGYSIQVNSRIKAFSVQPPFDYELVHTFPTDDMEEAETLLHDRFSEKRLKGEWFSLDDQDVLWVLQLTCYENECFQPDIEKVNPETHE